MANQALISVKTFSVDAIGTLRETLKVLKQKLKIMELSSVYLVKMVEGSREVHHLVEKGSFEGLAVVFLVRGEVTAKELLSHLKDMEKQIDRGYEKSAKLKLLTFNQLIKMTPDLHLPHPGFHLKPEELIPAAEIAPQFIHPVLKKSLFDLSKNLKAQAWGQFYAQGKSLLDKGI